MACCGQNTTTNCCHGGKGYLTIIVLYILLAIIVGSFIC